MRLNLPVLILESQEVDASSVNLDRRLVLSIIEAMNVVNCDVTIRCWRHREQPRKNRKLLVASCRSDRDGLRGIGSRLCLPLQGRERQPHGAADGGHSRRRTSASRDMPRCMSSQRDHNTDDVSCRLRACGRKQPNWVHMPIVPVAFWPVTPNREFLPYLCGSERADNLPF